MPDHRVATASDVRLILPEDWWVIPLQPPQARRRSVERLVARRFAGLDDQPLLRADTVRVLLEQADRAAGTDARLLALSLLEVAGVPVPASLVLHQLDVPPPTPASASEPGALLVAVEERLRGDGAAVPPGFSLDLGRIASGPVLRRVHEEPAAVDGSEPFPSLVADYWMERPDGSGLVQLAFATPMVALRDGMLELFDAVAGALRWVDDDADGSTAGDGGATTSS